MPYPKNKTKDTKSISFAPFYELFDQNPEFEFNFGKYLERNGFNAPDVVSLLFGANGQRALMWYEGLMLLVVFIIYLVEIIEFYKMTNLKKYFFNDR